MDDSLSMMKIAHLLNPVKVAKNNELNFAQKVTFQSIQRALAETKSAGVEIVPSVTSFLSDEGLAPNNFVKLSALNRAVYDANPQLSKKRKLPLIKDILEKANEIPDVDYVIYSNIDIALMPYFYDAVIQFIRKGHDAVIINRRRLTSQYSSLDQLNEMYADIGELHPGFDCFVFKQSLLKDFVLSDICVGIPFLGVSLLHNIAAFAKNPLFLTNKHLTFHLGMNVMGFQKNAYYWHNRKIFFGNIYPQLKGKFGLQNFPYHGLPLHKRMLKWVLNPSLFTVNYLDLEGKNLLQKSKLIADELRWRFL